MKKWGRVTVSNRWVLLLVAALVYVWLLEAVDLVCFLGGWPQGSVLSRLVVVGIFGGGLVTLSRKINWYIGKIRWNGWLVAGTVVLVGWGLIKSVFPDISYDTFNYHLLNQAPGFVNLFEHGYGAGSFQVWGFRLGDRLLGVSRWLLGYRYGTLLNTAVWALIFIQISQMLRALAAKMSIKSVIPVEIWAFLAVITEWNLTLLVGTYYVDSLGVPLFLEAIMLLWQARERQPTGTEVIWWAFLGGLMLALKMTNVVLVVPLVILYLVVAGRRMSWRAWLGAMAAGVIPMAVYLLFNFWCTHNPIFPYYNTLFHSPYYIDQYNFKDSRWGPQNQLEHW
ncbi:hypothetical protein IJJ12_00035, partial [bacterium]|nr:hypothetical protein [bacterium]